MGARRRTVQAVLVVVTVSACGAPARPSVPPDLPTPTPAATARASLVPAATPVATAQASPEVTAEAPPVATLVAGHVERVAVVGAYTWAGLSEASPWLPASMLEPVRVPASSEVWVRIEPDRPVEAWTARAAAVDDLDASAIIPVGEGRGLPRFLVPAAGPTVVAVHVVFAGGAGDATYYWHLDTR